MYRPLYPLPVEPPLKTKLVTRVSPLAEAAMFNAIMVASPEIARFNVEPLPSKVIHLPLGIETLDDHVAEHALGNRTVSPLLAAFTALCTADTVQPPAFTVAPVLGLASG